jgi:hypothetical protein
MRASHVRSHKRTRKRRYCSLRAVSGRLHSWPIVMTAWSTSETSARASKETQANPLRRMLDTLKWKQKRPPADSGLKPNHAARALIRCLAVIGLRIHFPSKPGKRLGLLVEWRLGVLSRRIEGHLHIPVSRTLRVVLD